MREGEGFRILLLNTLYLKKDKLPFFLFHLFQICCQQIINIYFLM